MKPERIQLTATLPGGTRGVFQNFQFFTFREVAAFSGFVSSMAVNHGWKVSCSGDAEVNQLTVLVPVSTAEQTNGAVIFLEKVADVYAEWSSPVKES